MIYEKIRERGFIYLGVWNDGDSSAFFLGIEMNSSGLYCLIVNNNIFNLNGISKMAKAVAQIFWSWNFVKLWKL
ncbi:unnamed protein product [Blepharisma stoltei]|uniref:Uncharacterized protein n=1 Tax=Blepharisma stoltei TaxID=1481888 RepID=A0AAU9JM58_9CILI|nr:unnamed protein product [Blepharisma stoltei]